MSQIAPVLALLLHANGAQRGQRGPKVLTVHKLRTTRSGPALEPGRILSAIEAARLSRMLVSPDARGGGDLDLLPEGLLRYSDASLTWWRAPGRSTQHWKTAKGRVTVDAMLPGLVFHVVDGVLHVAACGGTEHPTLQTHLYHAPLGNVFADMGRVCIGNVTTPRVWSPDTLGQWEDVLLSSLYTHTNHDSTLASRGDTTALLAFWKKRAHLESPPQAKLLSPLAHSGERLTLGGWIGSLSKAGAGR